MTLDQYRKSNRLSLAALAAQLGASHATVVRRWCLPLEHPQSMIPSPQFMLRIVDLTGGAVQPNDFYRTAGHD